MSKFSQRGVSVYITVLVMAILLSVILGMGTVLFTQMTTIRAVGYSVTAYYAAESGIEHALSDMGAWAAGNTYSGTLSNGSFYSVNIVGAGPSCSASTFCVRSVGTFKGTKRAIEIGL